MKRSNTLKILAVTAIVFGLLTIFSGSQALFGGTEAQAAAGNAVGFVLWFNFLAGFVYVLTGIGLFQRRSWSTRASLVLALSTAVVLAAFGVFVLTGGAYEMRTLGALVLRLGFWVLATILAKQQISIR